MINILKIAIGAFLIVLIGGAGNLSVIHVNGGKMPVLAGKGYRADHDDRHTDFTERTRLPLLADRFTFSNASERNVYSIGDLVMFFGAFGLVMSALMAALLLVAEKIGVRLVMQAPSPGKIRW